MGEPGNIVSLHPHLTPTPTSRDPSPDVVAFAEDLLARARSGDIHGLAAALTDGSHSYRCAGQCTLGTIGNIERMKTWLCGALDDLAAGESE